jgi:ribosomal-protein-alanine N-acetyltransferase
VIETDHLLLRTLSLGDVDDVAEIYADPEGMRYYPKTRTRAETRENLELLIELQAKRGFSLWATIHKADQRFISCRAMTKRWISEVPSPISHILASRR